MKGFSGNVVGLWLLVAVGYWSKAKCQKLKANSQKLKAKSISTKFLHEPYHKVNIESL